MNQSVNKYLQKDFTGQRVMSLQNRNGSASRLSCWRFSAANSASLAFCFVFQSIYILFNLNYAFLTLSNRDLIKIFRKTHARASKAKHVLTQAEYHFNFPSKIKTLNYLKMRKISVVYLKSSTFTVLKTNF